MNRQRRLIMRLCGLANAVPQLAAALVLCLLAAGTANAQQITGVPGSPDATVTINGRQLPLANRAESDHVRRFMRQPYS